MSNSKTLVAVLLSLFCLLIVSAAYFTLSAPLDAMHASPMPATHHNGISLEDWRRLANFR